MSYLFDNMQVAPAAPRGMLPQATQAPAAPPPPQQPSPSEIAGGIKRAIQKYMVMTGKAPPPAPPPPPPKGFFEKILDGDAGKLIVTGALSGLLVTYLTKRKR